MNFSLLDDEQHLKELEEKIPKWRVEGLNELSDKHSVWDWIKYNIRSHAISYSKQKAKGRTQTEQLLQADYDTATKLYGSN